MIYFLITSGHESSTEAIRRDPSAPRTATLVYDEVLKRSTLPNATYIFTDVDRLDVNTLVEAARLYRRLKEQGCRVLNDPATVRTRFSLLRGLYRAGLNPINVYLATEIEAIGQDATTRPTPRFPVFIRVADEHWGPLSDLIWNENDLDRAIEAAIVAGFPRSTIIIVEYASEPVRPGVFRKSSIFRIGDQFVPDLSWHDKTWNVKGDREGVVDRALLREELTTVDSDANIEQLKHAFAFADIDFGRLDYGLVEGKICIYEINTNPKFFSPREDPVPERTEGIRIRWGRLMEAFRAADTPGRADAEPLDTMGRSISALSQAGATYAGLRNYRLDLSKEQARRGDWQAALETVDAETEVNPDSIKTMRHRRVVLHELGRIDEAIAVATRIVRDSPRTPGARRNLALLLLEAGRPEEALEPIRQAVQAPPPDHRDQIALAHVLKAVGDVPGALAAAERAAEMKPGDPKAAECLAMIKGRPNLPMRYLPPTVKRLLSWRRKKKV